MRSVWQGERKTSRDSGPPPAQDGEDEEDEEDEEEGGQGAGAVVTDCSLFGSHRFISSLTLPASLMTPVFFSFFIFAVGDCPLLASILPAAC